MLPFGRCGRLTFGLSGRLPFAGVSEMASNGDVVSYLVVH